MSSLEINTLKPLFCKSLDKLYELQPQKPTTTPDVVPSHTTQPKLRSLRKK